MNLRSLFCSVEAARLCLSFTLTRHDIPSGSDLAADLTSPFDLLYLWPVAPGSYCPITSHVCVDWAQCASALAWEGVPTAKGQTVHCLILGAQPAASRLCGLHQLLPPGLRLRPDSSHWCLCQPAVEEAAKTGFPSLTEQWLSLAGSGVHPLTHIPTWLLSKEMPSPAGFHSCIQTPKDTAIIRV